MGPRPFTLQSLRRLTFTAPCASFRGHSATSMAKHGQHQQQETSAGNPKPACGGRQAVVELCEVTSCGLIFWSRQRFEVGSEMQVRVERSALTPAILAMTDTTSKWVMLKCLVAAGLPQRRADGSSGFKISLLVMQAHAEESQPAKTRSKMRWFRPPLGGHRSFGLN